MLVYDNNHPTNRLIVLASPLALQMLSKFTTGLLMGPSAPHQTSMTTNNNIEGFHHGFITLVGYNNPTIWDWIDAVKDRETLAFTDTWRHLSNQKPEKRYPAAVNRQVLLKAHLPNFSTLDIFNYLDGCNIAM